MASILNATTSSGLVTSADNSGSLQLATNNGTTAVTIDTSQNVGIGTTNPDFGSYGAGERILGISNPTSGTRARLSFQNLSTSTSGISGTLAFFNGSTILGSIDVGADGATNKGYYAFYTNDGTSTSERMRITSDGIVWVGASSGAWQGRLSIQSNSDTSYYPIAINNTASGTGSFVIQDFYRNGTRTGTITATGSATAYNTSSDYRLKENIAPMVGALATIQALKPVTFNWKIDGSNGQGFIAHELQAVVPDCVSGEKML